MSCARPTEVETDFATLASGVFVDHSQPVQVGRQAEAEIENHAIWEPLPVVQGPGWLSPTRSGWHPVGPSASLVFESWAVGPVAPDRLRIELRAARDAGELPSMTVLLDGIVFGTGRLEEGWQARTYDLTAVGPVDASRTHHVELRFDPPIAVSGPLITLVSLALGSEAEVAQAVERPEPVSIDPESEIVRLDASGVWTVPLDDLTGELGVEVRCTAGAEAIGLEILDRDGEPRAREAVEIDACRTGWVEARIEPAGEASGWGTLAIEVEALQWPAGIELRGLVRQARSVGRAAEPSTDDGPRWRSAGWPDVVVVILDAARADHFGVYGYERDTTPGIDRLADEALVFERAFSECPNTACSVPNLITGVPFMNLGTVFHGRRLPDEVMTLAEYLDPLGYRTVGLSANPNNSVSRNAHQGFDFFERLWGAHRQADLAIETIAQQPADVPLYLQLHLLPPHQPYMPEPEFDLFTDPDYEGPVHPKIGLRRYTQGLVTFSRVDLEQLIALYDGNLRMADDAVSKVVEALKARGRWDRTLFVLTADHGEAFGEHGDFQHNSTLFDEMLHVPLVLRLPGGEVPPGVDTVSPAALADVVPTVLGYLGLVPRPEVWGLNLLRRDPTVGGERFLFHRTNHRERPLLAIRSRRWKAITGLGMRVPMLFDLATDPGERSNLSAVRPRQFAGLTARLREFLADWEERVPVTLEDVELTSEEVELLRSLGYVE